MQTGIAPNLIDIIKDWKIYQIILRLLNTIIQYTIPE
jgi:hypothetical protein